MKKVSDRLFFLVKKITTFVHDNIQKTAKENGHNWESML